MYQTQGRYADAESLLKRALAILEKMFGPDHVDVGRSLNNLAGLYMSQDRYADAEPIYKRALAIIEKALGTDRRRQAPMEIMAIAKAMATTSHARCGSCR